MRYASKNQIGGQGKSSSANARRSKSEGDNPDKSTRAKTIAGCYRARMETNRREIAKNLVTKTGHFLLQKVVVAATEKLIESKL